MSEEITPLRLVAELRSPGAVAHDGVSRQLVELLPQTELAAAWATLREIEQRTGEVGAEALRCWPWLPPVELVAPQPPRYPVTEADLQLAARLLSPAVVVTDRVRRRLADHLARSPLGPAVWQIREIEWTMAAPPIAEDPPVGIAALDVWRFVGEQVDELVEQPHPEQAAVEDEGYHDSLVVHQLLHRHRALLFRDTHRCRDLAQLAVAVAEETMRDAATEWRNYGGLVALALASLANAHRILGETRKARALLGRAEPYIRGENDLVMRWEYYGLVAAILTNLRQPAEACEAADRAIGIAREIGDGHRLSRALTQRTFLDYTTGDVAFESLSRLKQAATLADPAREEWLPNAIRLNMARCQADLGLHEQAVATWEGVSRFKRPILELKRRGVLGYIHLAANRWEAAYIELAPAATGMIEAGVAEGVYFQVLAALALLGAGRLQEANERSLEAARFLAQADYPVVAMEAKKVADLASQNMINEMALDRLRKLVESNSDAVQALTVSPTG